MEALCLQILTEFSKRSGIKVFTGRDHMILEFGYEGYRLPGVYRYKQQQLWFAFENKPTRAIEILFHEMAHATANALHRDLNKPITHWLDPNYAIEEVIAETASGMIMFDLGFMTAQRDADVMQYISIYALNLSAQEIERAKDDARKAADFILENWLPDFAASCKKEIA